jgi:hypothetical protein
MTYKIPQFIQQLIHIINTINIMLTTVYNGIKNGITEKTLFIKEGLFGMIHLLIKDMVPDSTDICQRIEEVGAVSCIGIAEVYSSINWIPTIKSGICCTKG